MANKRDSGIRREEESFLFCLDHLPPHFNWQKLKDVVRETTKVGFVDVPTYPSRLSKGYGWCTVKQNADPQRLFNVLRNKFIDGTRLGVHYFNTTDDTAVFVDCNCTDFGFDSRHRHTPSLPNAIRANHSAASPGTSYLVNTQPVYPYTAQPAAPQSRHPMPMASPVSPNALAYSFQQVHLAPGAPIPSQVPRVPRAPPITQAQAPQSQTQAQPGAMYAISQNGTLVNSTRGLVATEACGIHIKGMSYSTKQSRLDEYLSTRGCKPESCRIISDSKGNSKGSATARYASTSKAQHAVDALNNTELDGRRITVKKDINRDAVSGGSGVGTNTAGKRHRQGDARPPMVVNGSSGRRQSNV